MKRISVWLACLGLTVGCQAGCNPQTRILVAGDSWAWIMQLAKSFERPFVYDVAYMAYTGETAENWHLYRQWQVTDFLETNEDVDIVLLCLGGNDLIGRGSVHETEEEKVYLVSDIGRYLEGVIDNMLSVRSDVKVALMSYDYPNWDESLDWPLSREVYQDDYEHIGSPESPIQVNSYLHLLAFEKWRIAGERDRVTFVNNYGLMQFKYGYPRYGISPGALPHPSDSPEGPVFGGDPAYYSPPQGLLSATPLFCDAYHLSIGGYAELARNAMERCIEGWLDDSFR